MDRRTWIAGYRVLFALLTLIAIGYQFLDGADNPDFRPLNFFSFFTIQSNLFAAAVLLSGARRDGQAPPSPTVDLVRGAAVLSLSLTGLVYGVLLAGYQEELQTTIPWVDTVLHRVMPLVMIADWLFDPPRTRIDLRRALPWLAYPVVYLVYSLVRGPFVDWYTYAFLDPDAAGGYVGGALYCVGITAGFLLGTWLIVWVGRRLRLTTAESG